MNEREALVIVKPIKITINKVCPELSHTWSHKREMACASSETDAKWSNHFKPT